MSTTQITATDTLNTERAEFIALISNPHYQIGYSDQPFMVVIQHQLHKGQYEYSTYDEALALAVEQQNRLQMNIIDEFDVD